MTDYIESTQGDLSNDENNPTSINLTDGSNIVAGSTTTSDKDFFTFTVAPSEKVTKLQLNKYTGTNKNSYFALTKANKFESLIDDSSYLVSKLIDDGGPAYPDGDPNNSEVGQDLLDPTVGRIKNIGGTGQGGPGELGPGTYTVWYQELASNTTYEFDIELDALDIVQPTASKLLLPGNQLIQVDLENDGANALQFSIEGLNLPGVSEFQLFKTDSNGNILNGGPEKTFSLLKPIPELAGFSPKFTVDGLNDNEYWQASLVSDDGTTVATTTQINDREVSLDFGNNNIFNLKLDQFDTGLNTKALQANNGDEYIDLSSENGTVTATFSVFREANFNNTVGFYAADQTGAVLDPITNLPIAPGEAGYKEAALARRLGPSLSGVNGQETITSNVSLEAGGFLGMFISVDSADPTAGDVFFSFMGANSDGSDHVKALGDNTFGFEDLVSLGDADFNDMTVNISFA